MAIIDRLPPKGIIRGYRKTLDFYVNQQRVIVRRWPRKPTVPRAPGVWTTLATSAALNKLLYRRTACGHAIWNAPARSTMWTWRDQVYRYHWGKPQRPGIRCFTLPNPAFPRRPFHHFFVYDATLHRDYPRDKPYLRLHYAASTEVRHLCQSLTPPHRHRVTKDERGQTLYCGHDLHLYPASCGGAASWVQQPGSCTILLGYIYDEASGWRYYQISRSSMWPLQGDCVSLSPIVRLWHYCHRLALFPWTRTEYAAIVPLSPAAYDLEATPPRDLDDFRARYPALTCPSQL